MLPDSDGAGPTREGLLDDTGGVPTVPMNHISVRTSTESTASDRDSRALGNAASADGIEG